MIIISPTRTPLAGGLQVCGMKLNQLKNSDYEKRQLQNQGERGHQRVWHRNKAHHRKTTRQQRVRLWMRAKEVVAPSDTPPMPTTIPRWPKRAFGGTYIEKAEAPLVWGFSLFCQQVVCGNYCNKISRKRSLWLRSRRVLRLSVSWRALSWPTK